MTILTALLLQWPVFHTGGTVLAFPPMNFGITTTYTHTHPYITRDAIEELLLTGTFIPGVTKITEPMRSARIEISGHNQSVDLTAPDNNTAYKHFDGESFDRGQEWVLSRLDVIVASLKAKDVRGARKALGQALHAIQDFYSHSNWVDRGETAPHPSLGRPGGSFSPLPATVSTCDESTGQLLAVGLTSGWYGGSLPPYNVRPAGKCRHGGPWDTGGALGINKDTSGSDWSPLGFSKHSAAASLAKAATKQFLGEIKSRVTLKELKLLLGVGGGTLSIAVDTTGSMGPIIQGVKQTVISMVDARQGTADEPSQYVLVPFNDPGVGPVTTTDDPNVFKAALNALSASGGGDCAELSVTGMHAALAAADEGGSLFMFTDADPKDAGSAPAAMSLAKAKDIQVYPKTFGTCVGSAVAESDAANDGGGAANAARLEGWSDPLSAASAGAAIHPVYLRMADESGGQAFALTESEAAEIAKLSSFLVRPDAVNLLSVRDVLAGTPKTYLVPVDSTMSRVTFSVSGTTTVSVKRPDGTFVNATDPGVSYVPFSGGAIYSVATPPVGPWRVSAAGSGAFSVNVSGVSPLSFSSLQFLGEPVGGAHPGLSNLPGAPVSGAVNKVAATLGQRVNSAAFDLRSQDGTALQSVSLLPTTTPPNGEYLGEITLPDTPVSVYVTGFDINGKAFQRVVPRALEPQSVTLTPPVARDLIPGRATTYTFQVKNLGPPNTFKFTGKDDKGYLTSLTPESFALNTNEVKSVGVVLTPPADAVPNTSDTLSATVESVLAPGVSNYAILTSAVVATNRKISGRVTAGAAGLAGVTVRLSGGATAAATTDLNGNYSFANLPTGANYTVTAARLGYLFTPSSRTFTALASDQTAANFTAAAASFSIGGRVAVGTAGLGGVTVTLSGSRTAAATTDLNGNYSFAALPAGGDYTVTPSKADYLFTPANRKFVYLSANQAAPFSAVRALAIEGKVTAGTAALPGVTVTLSGTKALTATTDAAGLYKFAGLPAGGNYTVTPSKLGYTFTPAGRTFTALATSQPGVNFSGVLKTFSVAGKVLNGTAGVPGVSVRVTSTNPGFAARTVTTLADGAYTLAGLPAGLSYTVAPVSPVYSFTPASRAYTSLAANQAGQNFSVLSRKTYAVSGKLLLGTAGLAGQAVRLTSTNPGFAARAATTLADGSYSFAGVPAGYSYTLAPAASGVYSYTPASRSYASLTATLTGQNFAAARRAYAISGRVTVGTLPLSGVVVALTGASTLTATTDLNGNYSFAALPAGLGYTVKPSKAGYSFTPASRTYSSLTASQTAGFAAASAATFSSGPLARAVSDLAPLEVPILVSGTGAVSDVNVRLRLNHTWDEDLDIFLVGPDGTTVELTTDNGGSGDNYGSGAGDCTGTFTVFDGGAAAAVTAGAAPFAGAFWPEQTLSVFNGKASAGTWKLRVVDDTPGDGGTLFCWQLQMTRN